MKISEQDYKEVSLQEAIGVAELKTIKEVESAGAGHLPDGRPKILFEGHVFYRNLPADKRAAISKKRPDLCHKSWTKAFYRGGAAEWDRLDAAIHLDRDAALKACSWGAFQILGENYKQAGFVSVQAFVNAMFKSERFHLEAVCNFIKGHKTMHMALLSKDWRVFARHYNGPAYEQNNYHIKLANAYKKFSQAAV